MNSEVREVPVFCPACGAPEVDSGTPRTTYACGSSDYDACLETFVRVCSMDRRADSFRRLDELVDQVRPTKPTHDVIGLHRLIELSSAIVDHGERVAIASLCDGELSELVAGYRALMAIRATVTR